MKKIIALSMAAFFVVSLFAQKPDDVAKFGEEKHSFGKIQQNVPARYEFEFTNTTQSPLVVENATAGCGCTTPEKPEAPVMPGQKAKIKVQYNAAAMGPFTKQVFVKFVGVNEQKVLTIEGEVISETDFAEYVKTQKKEVKEEKKDEKKTAVVAKKTSKKKKNCVKC
jgi:hypothetical protein